MERSHIDTTWKQNTMQVFYSTRAFLVKLDGYRAIAFRSAGHVHLRSRNDKDFSGRYSGIAKALSSLPDETVIDGEVVALDEAGRPSFSALQNYGSYKGPLLYYVFDVLTIRGRDVTGESLSSRRELLHREILPKLREPIRVSAVLDASLPDLIHAVKAQGLEGLVAKRKNSRYESGQRSGAWQKMRYYQDGQLLYVARTRNGFTPASRDELFKRFKGLETPKCPFVNLPETRSGRWGQGITPEKMADCVWLMPVLVGQFEFLEWTPDDHLRHSRFVGLRKDKPAEDVVRDSGREG
jgi:ATP-dependent DNA ligase